MMTAAVMAVALSAMSAGPAMAHFCHKSGWTEAAQAGAAKSQAWMTADEWRGFIDFAVDQGWVCEAGGDAAHTYIDNLPTNTLFMGPGLLAGGTIMNGKGKTPSRIGHVPVWEFEELCSEASLAH